MLPQTAMFDRKTLDETARYVLDRARYAIESFGPRSPGSEGEKRLQDYVRERLVEFTGQEAEIEPFRVAQKAFMSVPIVTAGFLLASYPAFWLHPSLANIFSLMGLAVGTFELYRYEPFIDFFFPKKTSYNVLGRKRPRGKILRRLVLNAHPDAAYEWRWNYLVPQSLPLFLIFGLLALPLKFSMDTAAVGCDRLMQEPQTWVFYIGIAELLLLPACIQGLLFTNYRVVSPGANDNLTGVFIVLGIAKALHDNEVELENTEVVFLNTGSEEAGLRGAKHFVKKQEREYRDLPSVFLTLDTFRDLDRLSVYNRDMNGTVKHDADVAKLVKRAGEECGLDLPYATVTVGSTDAAAFTQGGLRAVALAAMNPKFAPFYHTRRDNWDNMNEGCVRRTIEVVAKTLEIYDSEGIPKRDDWPH
jgi:hypothetical protein